jgi:CRP/FNR family transcriptional regulator/CRP/FNR family cyclic AMP-dependent transcriptional regulator
MIVHNYAAQKRPMETSEIETFFAKVPLFATLEEKGLKAIADTAVLKSFNSGEIIVQEQDSENQSVFIIVSGSVNVVLITTEGKQTILATLQKSDFFGEMALLDGEPRSASVIAAERCSLLILYRRAYLDIIKKFPSIAVQMLIEMSQRLRKANRHINTLSLMSVYGRVADVLLQIAQDKGVKSGTMTIIQDRPTHQIIADMAGTSRETVSRILSQLQKKGYIIIDKKKIIIAHEEKLLD